MKRVLLKSFLVLKRKPRLGERVRYLDGGEEMVTEETLKLIRSAPGLWFPVDQGCEDCEFYKSGCPTCRARKRGF